MSVGLKIIVTGGRDYANAIRVREVLDAIDGNFGIARLAEGGARGADQWAREWAMDRGKDRKTHEAYFSLQGKKAGPIRNSKMLAEEKPDVVVAFPGNEGTADMIEKARRKGVTIIFIDRPEENHGQIELFDDKSEIAETIPKKS
jgi:hypothetical protein